MIAVLAGILAPDIAAAELKPQAREAFDRYVAQAETQIRQQESTPESFLSLTSFSADRRNELQARLRGGEVLVEKHGATPTEVPGALIHHWIVIARFDLFFQCITT